MKISKVASLIALKEGKKSQTHIGNVREILKCLVDCEVDYQIENDTSIGGPLHAIENLIDDKVHRLASKKDAKRKK